MKKHQRPIIFFLLLLLSPLSTFADIAEQQLQEINHLLAFVKNSGCLINRNGADHPAEEGAQHIKNKYKYFKSEINNTNDFILYSATKSTMSGEHYMVICPEKVKIKSQGWLNAELKKYRLTKE